MKRIITTVGVSLIRNYLDYYVNYLSKELSGHCEDISGKYKRVVDDEEARCDCREYLKSNYLHVRDIK
ncbi:MAG: hypothetical protein GX941_08960, partial [Candidatus Methanofastidiosa archaeon]|nr:hypothetical protein [Candidatus Methanofastidiosa archaeon]